MSVEPHQPEQQAHREQLYQQPELPRLRLFSQFSL
jgi:hypothetical protein